ncbi:hypothetical protein [Subtercola endophyticus]|uniref:hypothetical protein n=1 Tax=Subtercola endophyticus TaxID=2895559 RepID=UPI001E465F3F|nr:hypothetical protein [Subtercola endophyticus]UFS57636.1 hypothetical protein LQ955_11250 [Subtercola endophyticus]
MGKKLVLLSASAIIFVTAMTGCAAKTTISEAKAEPAPVVTTAAVDPAAKKACQDYGALVTRANLAFASNAAPTKDLAEAFVRGIGDLARSENGEASTALYNYFVAIGNAVSKGNANAPEVNSAYSALESICTVAGVQLPALQPSN